MFVPSDAIRRRIEDFAETAPNYPKDWIIEIVTEIVDEAVREAILTTAKVFKED